MITCISAHGHELQEPQCKMLSWLSQKAMEALGADTPHIDGGKNISQMRTARIGDIALVEIPADETGPKCIHCLRVTVQKFTPARQQDGLTFGKRFFIDRKRVLFSLQHLHNATPPDFELLLHQDPRQWFDLVCFALLAAIRRYSPHLLDWQAMPKDITAKLNAHDASTPWGCEAVYRL